MDILSRRRTIKLASSFAAAFPFLKGGTSRAQVARGRVAKVAVAVDRTCVKESIHVGNNSLA
jgi:hypothetical protein